MRQAGFDIASASYSAFALVVDDELIMAETHKPNDKWSETEKLTEFFGWCRRLMFIYKPDIVSVEKKMGYKNQLQTAMMLGRREGIAILAAGLSGAVVVNPGVTTSRLIVFGNGSFSKDQCWEKRAEIWPGFDFGKKTVGGTDKVDAATHALAARKAIERKK